CIVIGCAARCFVRRRRPTPETFPLVGIGLLSGLFAALINAGISMELVTPDLDLVGRRLLTEGMVLLLVLGIGGFLGPRLLGFAQMPNFQIGSKAGSKSDPKFYAAAGVLIFASVFLQYAYGMERMAWLRAAIASALAVS